SSAGFGRCWTEFCYILFGWFCDWPSHHNPDSSPTSWCRHSTDNGVTMSEETSRAQASLYHRPLEPAAGSVPGVACSAPDQGAGGHSALSYLEEISSLQSDQPGSRLAGDRNRLSLV